MSDASISKEMRPPAVEAVQSAAQCTPYIFLCRVDFVRCLEESCMNTITSVREQHCVLCRTDDGTDPVRSAWFEYRAGQLRGAKMRNSAPGEDFEREEGTNA